MLYALIAGGAFFVVALIVFILFIRGARKTGKAYDKVFKKGKK